MLMKVSFISQKGSVLKTSLGRALAAEAVNNNLRVKVCDFDTVQGSFLEWHMRRLDTNKRRPIDSVESFRDVKQALKASNGYDLTIFDTAGRAEKVNIEIAKASDLIIMPTTTGFDDLSPNIKFAHLIAKKVDKKKMVFLFTKMRGKPLRSRRG
jgi:cellulose biosynthesis protein BcsQ